MGGGLPLCIVGFKGLPDDTGTELRVIWRNDILASPAHVQMKHDSVKSWTSSSGAFRKVSRPGDTRIKLADDNTASLIFLGKGP